MTDPKPYCVIVDTPNRCWFANEHDAQAHAAKMNKRHRGHTFETYMVTRRTDDVLWPVQSIEAERSICLSRHAHNYATQTGDKAMCEKTTTPANPFTPGTPEFLIAGNLVNRLEYLTKSQVELARAQENVDSVQKGVDEFRAAVKAITGKKCPI